MALGTGAGAALVLILNIVHPLATGVPVVMLVSGMRDWHFLMFPVPTGCLLLLTLAFLTITCVLANAGRCTDDVCLMYRRRAL